LKNWEGIWGIKLAPINIYYALVSIEYNDQFLGKSEDVI
jgi:hypothetical protein